MQDNKSSSVDFIDKIELISVFHMVRNYHAAYFVEGENVRMTARVERYKFIDHLPLAGKPAATVAERLLANIIRDNHNRLFPHDEDDFGDLEETLAELDRL